MKKCKRNGDIVATVEKLGYTKKEAALALGVSVGTVHNLTERGLLHPSIALRRPIYSKADLLAFLANTTGQLIETE